MLKTKKVTIDVTSISTSGVIPLYGDVSKFFYGGNLLIGLSKIDYDYTPVEGESFELGYGVEGFPDGIIYQNGVKFLLSTDKTIYLHTVFQSSTETFNDISGYFEFRYHNGSNKEIEWLYEEVDVEETIPRPDFHIEMEVVLDFYYPQKKMFDEYNAIENIENNAGLHNSIYRGKNLGSEYTLEQKAMIANGTFDDLYIGDYWETSDNNLRIAAFDYYRHTGGQHHVLVVPDFPIGQSVIYEGTTLKAYGVSDIRNNNNLLRMLISKVSACLNYYDLLNFRLHLVRMVTSVSGYEDYNVYRPYDSTGYDCKVELLSERMVFGSPHLAIQPSIYPYTMNTNTTVFADYSFGQLPLFFFNPNKIFMDGSTSEELYCYQLRDLAVGAPTNYISIECSKLYDSIPIGGNTLRYTRPYFCLC